MYQTSADRDCTGTSTVGKGLESERCAGERKDLLLFCGYFFLESLVLEGAGQTICQIDLVI